MKSVDNNEIITKTTEFVTSGIKLLAQKTGEDVLTWQIDGNGSVLGFIYNEDVYFYIKNAQGDIVGIADSLGEIKAEYTYNSWGKLISVKDENGVEIVDKNHIGHKNPLRYRGYYYDDETQLYYLNARYYDPEIGRFINADDNLEGGLNLFSYCHNNPVNFADYTGRVSEEIKRKIRAIAAMLLEITAMSSEIKKMSFGKKERGEHWEYGTFSYHRVDEDKWYHFEPRTDNDAGFVCSLQRLDEIYHLIEAGLIDRMIVIHGHQVTLIDGVWEYDDNFSEGDMASNALMRDYASQMGIEVDILLHIADGRILIDKNGEKIELVKTDHVDPNMESIKK